MLPSQFTLDHRLAELRQVGDDLRLERLAREAASVPPRTAAARPAPPARPGDASPGTWGTNAATPFVRAGRAMTGCQSGEAVCPPTASRIPNLTGVVRP